MTLEIWDRAYLGLEYQKYPNQYDRVNDIYGPGAILCWFIVAYTVFAQFILSDSHSDTIRHDLVVTLSYPVLVAGHLVTQVSRFPGPRSQIWTMTNEQVIQHAAAIWASTRVCVIALGINSVLAGTALAVAQPRRPKRRICTLAISSFWIFIALCITGLGSDLKVFEVFLVVLAVGLCGVNFIALFCFTSSSLYVFFLFVLLAIHTILDVRRASTMQLSPRVGILSGFLAGFVLSAFGSAQFFAYWVLFFCPLSKHSLIDLGQTLSVVGGCINAGFFLFGKQHFAIVWEQIQGSVDHLLGD